jgi:glycoprotein-N-acetylgalactosamine 3-beta-galactosyltransferase
MYASAPRHLKKASQSQLPISIKTIIQLGIFLTAVGLVIYFYRARTRKLRTAEEFASFLANREQRPEASLAAQRLPLRGSIFCWILTAPLYHDTRVPAVNQTWLNRCDHGEFFTSAPINDSRVPYTTVFASFSDDYGELFWKTIYALRYAYENISNEFEWYLKADDDSYIIMENLRNYLSRLNSSEPLFIGFRMKPYLPHGYNSGGAYVLSRAAMHLFSERLYQNQTLCPFNEWEDVGLAKCFERLGIYPLDTRDNSGRQRFLAYDIQQTFDGSIDDSELSQFWLMDTPRKGFDAFSDELISVHHMSPEQIRTADLFLYRIGRRRHGTF